MAKPKTHGSENENDKKPDEPVDETQRPLSLADVKLGEIGRLERPELLELCRREGLPAKPGDDPARMAFLLRAKKRGGHLGYVHGHSLCPVCLQPMTLYKTIPQDLDDGRILTTRYMRCPDPKRRHRFQYKTIEKKPGRKG